MKARNIKTSRRRRKGRKALRQRQKSESMNVSKMTYRILCWLTTAVAVEAVAVAAVAVAAVTEGTVLVGW